MAILDAAIGAGDVMAGGLLTLLGERSRRGWENRQRWQEDRRRAYAEFMYTARLVFVDMMKLIELRVDLARDSAQLDEAKSRLQEVERTSEEHASSIDESQALLGVLTALKERQGHLDERLDQLKSSIDPAWTRLNQASAELALIASPPVLKAVRAHFKIIDHFHNHGNAVNTTDEYVQLLKKVQEPYKETSETMQEVMREELGIKPF
jgi:hypothetical protein